MAPNDAPAPMSPKSRFAWRVSNREFAKLHAWTGAMIPKQLTQTKNTAGNNSTGWKRKAYQNPRTFVAKNSNVTTVTVRVPIQPTARLYNGTKNVSAIGTAA